MRPARTALLLATLLALSGALDAAAAPPAAVAPPPAAAPSGEERPADRVARHRAEIDAELAAARERLAALPADGAEEARLHLGREIELLERIGIVLGQHASALEREAELGRAIEEMRARVAALRTDGPPEAPPYGFGLVDAARDALEAEQHRTEAVDAAAAAAAASIQEAQRELADRETERRRAREAEQLAPAGAERSTLARDHRLAQLESRRARERLELREAEKRREALEASLHAVKLELLQERVGWFTRSVQFTGEELQARLLEIESRRLQARQRLDLVERRAAWLEREWAEARVRLDAAASPPPALVEEVEARQLGYQARKEEIDAENRRLERLADAERIWQRRHAIATSDPDQATLSAWIDEARTRVEADAAERRLQSARLADLRNRLAGVGTQLEAVDLDPEIARWLRARQEHLREITAVLEERLASIDRANRLSLRLLEELGVEAEQITLAERIVAAVEVVRSVWIFEITTVGEQPITVGKIVVGLIVLIVGLSASRMLSRVIGRRVLPMMRLNEGAAAAVQSLLFYVLVVTFLLLALRAVNIPLTAFTVLGGALAIGVGFGSQAVIGNFISGLILLAERPIRVGDLVQIDALFGTIEHIGARSTRVRTGDNAEIIVPNSQFLDSRVINWTLSEDRMRTKVTVGIAYGSPTRDAAKLLRRAVEEHGRVLKSPAPVVIFQDFGSDALVFDVYFWIRMRTVMDRRVIESDVRFLIDHFFRDAGIVIAFPQRDVHIDGLGPIELRLQRSPRGEEDGPGRESPA